ncbi:hypothetical protein DAI22_12g195350 [Oryza sativa Japonica Group]|nr:hypothetical protein DAI22_12g195350 [Oryza sativa Japonica Group]
MPWCKISLKLRFLRSDRGYSGPLTTKMGQDKGLKINTAKDSVAVTPIIHAFIY